MNPQRRATPRRPVLASFLAAMLLVGACGGATGDGSDDDFAGGGTEGSGGTGSGGSSNPHVLVTYGPGRMVVATVSGGAVTRSTVVESRAGARVSVPIVTRDRAHVVYAVELQAGDPWQIVVYDVRADARTTYTDISSPQPPTVFMDESQRWVVFGRDGGAWFQASLSDFVPQALSGTGSVQREGAFIRVDEATVTVLLPEAGEWRRVAEDLGGEVLVAHPAGDLIHHEAEAADSYADTVMRISRVGANGLTPVVDLEGPTGKALWKPDSRELVRTRCTLPGVCNELCHVDLAGDATERCLVADGSSELRFSPSGRYLLAFPPGASGFLEVFDTAADPWTRAQPGLASDEYQLLPLRAHRADLFFFEDFAELFYFDLRDGFPGEMRSAAVFAPVVREADGPRALFSGRAGDAGLGNGTALSSFDVDRPEQAAQTLDESLNVYDSNIQWSSDGRWAAFLGSDGASAELGVFIVNVAQRGAAVRLGSESSSTFNAWIFR